MHYWATSPHCQDSLHTWPIGAPDDGLFILSWGDKNICVLHYGLSARYLGTFISSMNFMFISVRQMLPPRWISCFRLYDEYYLVDEFHSFLCTTNITSSMNSIVFPVRRILSHRWILCFPCMTYITSSMNFMLCPAWHILPPRWTLCLSLHDIYCLLDELCVFHCMTYITPSMNFILLPVQRIYNLARFTFTWARGDEKNKSTPGGFFICSCVEDIWATTVSCKSCLVLSRALYKCPVSRGKFSTGYCLFSSVCSTFISKVPFFRVARMYERLRFLW